MKILKFKVLMKGKNMIKYNMNKVSESPIPVLYSETTNMDTLIGLVKINARMGFVHPVVVEELKKCKLVDCELKIMDDEKQN